MEFEITDKAKNKARIHRIRKEKKWLPFRIIYIVAFILSLLSLAIGLVLPNDEYRLLEVFGFSFALFLIVGVMVLSFVLNLTRHWIQDRFNERLWVDEHTLCHLFQSAWGAGLNYRSLDDTATMYMIDISTINKVRYDERTKRIEIFGRGIGRDISSLSRWIVGKEWPLTDGYCMETYDYFEPSLVETLEKKGITISREEINNFKMFDNTI